MADRVVVLHSDDGLSFIASGCAALAEAANELRLVTSAGGELLDAYAEMVLAYGRLVRPRLLEANEAVRVAVLDHLVERLAQARSGLISLRVIDIVDRLHAELTRESARV